MHKKIYYEYTLKYFYYSLLLDNPFDLLIGGAD